jgi:hypothetical protein
MATGARRSLSDVPSLSVVQRGSVHLADQAQAGRLALQPTTDTRRRTCQQTVAAATVLAGKGPTVPAWMRSAGSQGDDCLPFKRAQCLDGPPRSRSCLLSRIAVGVKMPLGHHVMDNAAVRAAVDIPGCDPPALGPARLHRFGPPSDVACSENMTPCWCPKCQSGTWPVLKAQAEAVFDEGMWARSAADARSG